MSGRGHRASLPPGGFTAEPPLAASGLVVTVVNKAGHEADPPDDLDGLTVALLKRWRAAHVGTNDGRHAMAVIRALLRQDPRLRSGPVADELARRIPNPRPSGQSYDEAERERVMLAARRQFRAALQRIRENAGLLQRWEAGELPEGSG